MTARTRTAALLTGAALAVGGVVAAAGLAAAEPEERRATPAAATAPVVVEDEGPGTETVPVREDEGPGTGTVPVREDEGPGTGTVPVREDEGPGTGEVADDEGPGTDTRPAPVYGSASPASWRLAVPRASVYAVPGDTGTRTGEITDRSADVAGTGRTATVGVSEWVEVKVPGATTGWVVLTELERL